MAGSEDELDDEEAAPLEAVATQVVTSLTLAVGLGLLFLGVSYFWVAFVVGFAAVLPAARTIARYYDHQQDDDAPDASGPSDTAEAEDALETLRQRYARRTLRSRVRAPRRAPPRDGVHRRRERAVRGRARRRGERRERPRVGARTRPRVRRRLR